MRLKGVRIVERPDGDYRVTPLFWSKRGGTRPAVQMAERGAILVDVLASVVAKLIARGNLKG